MGKDRCCYLRWDAITMVIYPAFVAALITLAVTVNITFLQTIINETHEWSSNSISDITLSFTTCPPDYDTLTASYPGLQPMC